jgi:hypothetical protein
MNDGLHISLTFTPIGWTFGKYDTLLFIISQNNLSSSNVDTQIVVYPMMKRRNSERLIPTDHLKEDLPLLIGRERRFI